MTTPSSDLTSLRDSIDAIDEKMHALLIERSNIIDRLIAVKRTAASGSAFRPGREMDIMRRLAARHRGSLPLDTAESIWRVIISTFTYLQAPHSVHADIASGDAAMRDTARFHFGFTVPFVTHRGASAVIEAVAASAGDLGIFPVQFGMRSLDAWWRGLEGLDRPKIIARLPFIERANHPAGTPVYVIAKPLAEASVREVIVYSLKLDRWDKAVIDAIEAQGGSVQGSAGDGGGLSLMLSIPGGKSEALYGLEKQYGARLAEVGSHAAPVQIERKAEALPQVV